MSPKIKACLLMAPAVAIALAAFALLSRGHLEGHAQGGFALQDRPAVPPATLEFCRSAAELLHDITWAAMCEAVGDDSVDCTLPDRAAADANAVFRAEERRCLAAEALGDPVSPVPPSPRDGPTGRTARR